VRSQCRKIKRLQNWTDLAILFYLQSKRCFLHSGMRMILDEEHSKETLMISIVDADMAVP